MLRWDSPVMLFLRTAVNYVFVTLIMAVCALPVVTLGASATAGYDTVRRCLIREEGHIAPTFFKSFAANWRPATYLWLGCGMIGVVLWQGGRIMRTLYPDSLWGAALEGVLILAGLVVISVLLYGLAHIARFVNGLGAIVRNSLLLALRNGWRTLGLLAILAAGVLLIRLVPLLALIVPALFVFFWCRTMEKAFSPYLPPEAGDTGAEHKEASQKQEE